MICITNFELRMRWNMTFYAFDCIQPQHRTEQITLSQYACMCDGYLFMHGAEAVSAEQTENERT